jgi:hypothetical protein
VSKSTPPTLKISGLKLQKKSFLFIYFFFVVLTPAMFLRRCSGLIKQFGTVSATNQQAGLVQS